MRSRVAVPGRVWQVVLLLGGFLVLAFVLSAQAHADAPDNRSVPSAPVRRPTLVVSLERAAERSVKAGKAQADRGVQGTVAAATQSGDGQPTTGLLDTVQDVTHQVTIPVGEVIGTVTAGHGGSGHGAAGRSGSAPRPTAPSHDARFVDPASRTAGHPGAPSTGRAPAGRFDRVTPSRAPGGSPGSAQHPEHPVEGDSGAHHTGGAYAAFVAVGARVHLSAVAMPAAYGPAPLKRASNVAVDPD
jgi:hypothetical protein